MSACPAHAQRGLPRPLETAPDGCLRPIPWTQSDEPDGWGQIDEPRLNEANATGSCLVCGEFVQEGVVFWDTKPLSGNHLPPPALCTFENLGLTHARGNVTDGGALHHRCALLTRAHCRRMRDYIHSGQTVIVPYIGPTVYGRS